MNIPVKPEGLTFTDDQWKAIWASGKDVLVSAAAGSGKTKVLITRMIEKVIDEENPIDVDELLVVTFTNAAAAEMRNRMAAALEKAIVQNPESTHLRRQLNLINKAQISTLHSFCQHIVRQYAYLLEIDPGFRIADSTETAILRDDTISDVLEAAYQQEDVAPMYRLADSFTSDRDDRSLEMLIDRLYDYSRVHPSPEMWLRKIPAQYDIGDEMTIDQLSFMSALKMSIAHALQEAKTLVNDYKRIAEMPDGPLPLAATAKQDLLWIKQAIACFTEGSWEETYEFFKTLKWARAASVPEGSCDEQLTKRAKALRDDVKKKVKAIYEAYFIRTPQRLLDEIRLMAPSMETLIELVLQFGEAYEKVKIDKGIVDFSDLEHYALRILSQEDAGIFTPSDVAIDYQSRFAEILVDEYQDTNLLQETILQLIKKGDESNGNLFMVGDVKQSIYGFRLAEPQLFLGKYKKFTNVDENTGLRIDLNANFRSRKEVLDATNFIFTQVMSERVGEIAYDDAASLKYGAQYPEKNHAAELVLLNKTDEVEMIEEHQEEETQTISKAQAEAQFIISRIEQMMANKVEVTDAFLDEKRPLQYRDIVILMRSMTWTAEMVEEFKLAGIPIHANISKGYFETIEIMIMLNTLRIIDNPYQDIALASVLRAPFVGLTENELALIRLCAPNESFYEAMQQFIATGANGLRIEAQEKLQTFAVQLERWRDLARHGSLPDLIWQVYSDTFYFEMVGTMANGKQRQANLHALHDRARDYEKTSFRGLFRFLRFVDRMRLRGDDLGEARSVTEQENVVRIMTIHSSKGLEFPYVFIAGMGREFNKMDFNKTYLFDQHFGLAVQAVDPEKRITYKSLPFMAVKEKKELEMRAEEMRILYVAMTRAKEQLTMIATVDKIEQELEKWQEAQLIPAEDMLPEHTRSRANRYIDWVGPAVARHPVFQKFDTMIGANFLQSDAKWTVNAYPMHMHSPKNGNIPDDEDSTAKQEKLHEKMYREVAKRFNWSYSYEASTTKRSKQSVSELKRLAMLEQQEDGSSEGNTTTSVAYLHERPAFMQKRALSSAEIGTAMHTMMQHIPLHDQIESVKVEQLTIQLTERQLLTEEEASMVQIDKVVGFFTTSIGQRLQEAKTVYRELPFTYAFDAKDGDYQLIQGIADCLFEEDDGWVLVDYKTDYVASEDEVVIYNEMQKRYKVQLNLYKRALESIANIRIKEMVLYLFNGERTVKIQEEQDE